ncbi:MAG: retroviral-like aspartic protease family protein, partial [Candidatus Thiodiazotropha endolucinida]|nr:retroviral-like aspartic protease family protein [Candidatus Thiodiazotropha taylori]MCW4342476.1 retroviral-like aspartic protease family protein [Candidatus Thiodiazotropha endolucinida]
MFKFKFFKLEEAVPGGHREACSQANGQNKQSSPKNDETVKSIKHVRKLPDGVYIRGTAQGYPVLFTTDTGASKTVLAKRVFDSMRPEDKPQLSKASKLIGAGGTTIREIGKGEFTLQLGPVRIQVEAIVAEIEDDGLLGVDVLQNSSKGPTDLMLSKGVLVINHQEVPVIQIGITKRVRKVTAADHYTIPAQSESVIDVYVERHEYDDFSSEKDYVIEPTDHFQAEYPLQMASTLVDINKACTCKVRMLNPFPTAMSIKQDAVIGKAEPIEGTPKVLINEEDKTEAENFVRARRVKLSPELSKECISSYTSRKASGEATTDVPCHLASLYQKTTQALSMKEKEKVAELLCKFQNNFSRDEWDLGLTHL